MRQLSIIALLVILFVPFNSVLAQNGGFAGNALSLGFGPRAMGVSNAMAASTFEGVYPYYNPSLAAFKASGNQVDMSVSALDFDRVYQTIGSTFQLPPNAGIYIGLIRSGVTNIDERSLSGYPLGTFDISEYQLNTSFGLRFSDRFYGGVSFKLNYANYHKEVSAATAVGVDLGFLYLIGNHLNLGFTVQDMFANYTWNSSELYGQSQSRNVVNNFPTRLKWALSYQLESLAIVGEYELFIFGSEVSEVSLFVDQTGNPVTINDLSSITTSTGSLKIGTSWKAHERFTLRGGYRVSDTKVLGSGSFSSGFSVHLPFDSFAPSIDYAFVNEPYGVSNIHVVAIRINL